MKSIVSIHNGYNLKYNLIHPHKIFIHLYQEIKSFIHRGIYGYAKKDVWSLDFYLATIISNAIKHLKDNHYGHPSLLTNDQWVEILDIMIKGFEAKIQMDNMCYKSDEWEHANRQVEKGMSLFIKYFDNLWD